MLKIKFRAYDIMRKMVFTNDSLVKPRTEYGRTHKFLSHYIGIYFTEVDNRTMQWAATTICFHAIELILMDLRPELMEELEYGEYEDDYSGFNNFFRSYGDSRQLIEMNKRVGMEIRSYDNRLNYAKDRHCLKWSEMITRCAFFFSLSTLGSHLDDDRAFNKYVRPKLNGLSSAAESALGYRRGECISDEYLKLIPVVSIGDTLSKTDPKELPFINGEHMLKYVTHEELKELFPTEDNLDTFLSSTLRRQFPRHGFDIIEKWESPLNSPVDIVGNDGAEDATPGRVEESGEALEKEIEEGYMEYMTARAAEEEAMKEESYKRLQEAEETDKTVKPVDPTSILTPKVLRYFERAIQDELLQKTEEGYLWIGGTDVLRDYFLGRVFCNDLPGKIEDGKQLWGFKNRAPRMPCRKLCIIFNNDKVGRARQNCKGGYLPEGHRLVDELYDAVTSEINDEKKKKH